MEPLYVSEIVSPVSTLSFGKVTIPCLPNQCFNVVLKLWRKKDEESPWLLHFEVIVDLRKLVMLKMPFKELDDGCLRDNSVIWCFDEKRYALPESVIHKNVIDDDKLASQGRGRNVVKLSYKVDDIRQLLSLDTGIKELALLNIKISQQIDSVLEAFKGKVSNHDPEVSRALKFKIHSLHRYVSRQRNNNDTVSSKVYERKILLGKINTALEDQFPPFKEFCEGQLDYVTSQIDPIHESLDAAVSPELYSSLKSIGELISQAFCMNQSGPDKLAILDTEFPSTTKELLQICYDSKRDHPPEEPSAIDKLNAGLSYIVAVMLLLADILGISLNYAMKYFGSRSIVEYHIQPPADRPGHRKSVTVTYPLFYDARHTERITINDRDGRRMQVRNVRFEQGLQLLQRNMVTLTGAAHDVYRQIRKSGERPRLSASETVDNLLGSLKNVIELMTAPYQAPEA